MGDMAKGIRSFRTGLKEEDETKSVDDDDMVNITPEAEKTASKD